MVVLTSTLDPCLPLVWDCRLTHQSRRSLLHTEWTSVSVSTVFELLSNTESHSNHFITGMLWPFEGLMVFFLVLWQIKAWKKKTWGCSLLPLLQEIMRAGLTVTLRWIYWTSEETRWAMRHPEAQSLRCHTFLHAWSEPNHKNSVRAIFWLMYLFIFCVTPWCHSRWRSVLWAAGRLFVKSKKAWIKVWWLLW